MPGIPVDGRKLPSVSADIFGERTPQGTEVTLIITRQGSVQMAEHDLMVRYASECLADRGMQLQDYADQVLAPHPVSGRYVEVMSAYDHKDGRALLVMATRDGDRLYTWDLSSYGYGAL